MPTISRTHADIVSLLFHLIDFGLMGAALLYVRTAIAAGELRIAMDKRMEMIRGNLEKVLDDHLHSIRHKLGVQLPRHEKGIQPRSDDTTPIPQGEIRFVINRVLSSSQNDPFRALGTKETAEECSTNVSNNLVFVENRNP